MISLILSVDEGEAMGLSSATSINNETLRQLLNFKTIA